MKDVIDEINSQWAKERPDLETLPLGLINRIIVLGIYIQRRFSAVLSESEVTLWEFDVLATLRRHGKPYRLSPSLLAKTTMLSASAMTNRVDRLVKRGLVVRENSDTDRRSLSVGLTEEGLSLVNRALTARAVAATEMLCELPPSELKATTIVMRKILSTVMLAD